MSSDETSISKTKDGAHCSEILTDTFETCHSSLISFVDSDCAIDVLKEYLSPFEKPQRKKFIDYKTKKSPSLLFKGIKKSRLDIVIYFLEDCDADVDVKCFLRSPGDNVYQTVTPLHLSAYQDCPEIMNILLSHGAELNYTTDFGWNALSFAAIRGNMSSFEFLLNQKGIKTTLVDTYGENVLSHSVNFSHIVDHLLANVKIADFSDCGKNALYNAIKIGNITTVKILLEHSDLGNDLLHVKLDQGLNALQTAALHIRSELMHFCMESGLFCESCKIQAFELYGIGVAFPCDVHCLEKCKGSWITAMKMKNAMKQRPNDEDCVAVQRNQQCCKDELFVKSECVPDAFLIPGKELNSIRDINDMFDNANELEVEKQCYIQACLMLQRHFGFTHEVTCDYGYRFLAEFYCSEKETDHIGFPILKQMYFTYLQNPERNSWRSVCIFILTQIATVMFVCRKHLICDHYQVNSVPYHYAQSILTFESILPLFEVVVNHFLSANNDRLTGKTMYMERLKDFFNQLPSFVCDLVRLTSEAIFKWTNEEQVSREITEHRTNLLSKFNSTFRKFTTCDPVMDKDESILHLAVTPNHYLRCYDRPIQLLASANEIEWFISAGAKIDVPDEFGNTPLMGFLLIEKRSEEVITPPYRNNEIVECLLNSGSHIDIYNKTGQCPTDLLSSLGHKYCSVKNRTLQCLSACVVGENNISYQHKVPKSISHFIQQHSVVSPRETVQLVSSSTKDALYRLLTVQASNN